MPQVLIKLTDGAYSGLVDGGELHSHLLSSTQYGDLNGDGIDTLLSAGCGRAH